MTAKSLITPVACLLAGLVIGLVLPDWKTVDTELAPPAHHSTPSSSKASDRYGMSTTRQSREQGSGEASSIGSLEETDNERFIQVPRSLLEELSLACSTHKIGEDLFSQDGRMEKHLEITDREKELIQKAWRVSNQKIRDLEANSMMSEESENGSLKISIPDLSQSVGPLSSDFRLSVYEALGENRAEAFLAIKQIDHVFTPHAGSRVYTVSPETTGDGNWRFHMTLEAPGGRRVWVGEKIPDELRHLIGSARIESASTP